tara:strand:- start:1161 stop:1733 length:573 start_codon:yes stop_codon:yes gene_type:complete
MIDNLNNKFSSSEYSCENIVEDKGSGEYEVSGNISAADGTMLLYWAANPPNYMTTYSGSGLPYSNPDIAFDNSPNKGAVKVINGKFTFNIHYPNSFYAGFGKHLITPHVYYKLCNKDRESKVYSVKIGESIPFRSLSHPKDILPNVRDDVYFYDGIDDLPLRNQETILRDSAYPSKNTTPDNFWGLSVPK